MKVRHTQNPRQNTNLHVIISKRWQEPCSSSECFLSLKDIDPCMLSNRTMILNVFENGCCNGWLNGEKRPVQEKENDFGVPISVNAHKLCVQFIFHLQILCVIFCTSHFCDSVFDLSNENKTPYLFSFSFPSALV